MVNIGRWERLDLRQRRVFGPYDDQLVAIRFVPKNNRGIEHYEVGRFQTEEGCSVFRGNYGGCELLSNARKKYDIWWTPLPKATPAEVPRRRV